MKKYKRYGNSIYTIQLNHLDKELHNLRGKWGFFYECEINEKLYDDIFGADSDAKFEFHMSNMVSKFRFLQQFNTAVS